LKNMSDKSLLNKSSSSIAQIKVKLK
jgi:hypothetical protein